MDYLNTAEVSRFALIFLGALLMIFCIQLGTQALFPNFVKKAQEGYQRAGRLTLIGLLIWFVVGLLSGLFAKIGLGVLSGLLLAVGVLLSVVGTTGLARKIGTGLHSPLDKEQPWRRTVRGGFVLMGMNAVPLVNLVILVPVLLAGMGATFRILLQMRKDKAQKDEDSDTDY
jgi:hypothetical protein